MNQTAQPLVNPKPAESVVAGHFGEFVQGRLGPDGPVALITIPCPAFLTRLTFAPRIGLPLTAEAPSEKAVAAARLTLARLGRPDIGGRLTVTRPVPVGLGAGSSTAETLGAVRAVAMAIGATLAPEEEARLCLAAETAIDPLMHGPAPMIFASRAGRILRRLPKLPEIRIIGGFAGTPIATDPADAHFPDMTTVFADFERAAMTDDPALLGQAARQSAEINQSRNPHPLWPALNALGAEVSALGVVTAHTGRAAGLILPPGQDERHIILALRGIGFDRIVSFTPG